MRPEIEQAVRLLRREDSKSLEGALALLQNTVFSFSMRVCGQREDAEDTSQEVLFKAIPYLPRFESARALLVWLYKVAKNRCLMSRRRSKFAPLHEVSLEALMPDRRELEQLTGGERINPEALAIRSQQAKRLREAVQKLPPPYRMVLVLRDMEGLSDQEVAEITGLRTGTVRVRLHRARLLVRREMLRRVAAGRVARRATVSPRPRSCKALFAELSDYLDGKLDDSLCQQLEKHLDGCQGCRAFLATLEATVEQCRKAPAECPDSRQAMKLREKLLSEYMRVAALARAQEKC